MAVTLKYRGSNPPPPSSASAPQRRGLLSSNLVRFAAILILAVLVIGIGVFAYFYQHFKSVVDDKLASGPLFAPVTQIYAAPRELRPGQTRTAAGIAADLRRAGYGAGSLLGTYELHGADSIFIKPGPQSFHSTDGATVTTTAGVDGGGKIQSITAENGAPLAAYQLEPQLISSLSEDKARTKRRLVTYAEIPPRLVQAVTSIEDRRFFEHGGVDYHRMAGAIYHDLFGHSRLTEGGSTITMQLARGFFLSPARTLQRKLSEILITFQLESRFSKEQIFDMYANQINLGQRGSFAINGFGEAAQSFFGKDLKNLDTAQLAMLAGLIQSPNRLNPYRHPERAIERRNLVLQVMEETGDLTPVEARAAMNEPLHLAPQNVDASDAPYFVDLVHEQLSQRLSDQEQAHASLRIYTSLDPDLQHAAADAVDAGMPHVDELVRKLDGASTSPQVALVALDPHTGQVLALVGGRNYANSQLDHATAKRPTGSIFKPWVYAAAYAAAVNGQTLGDNNQPFTAVTILNDTETTFTYDNGRKTYNPHNKLSGYKGDVTAAYALAHSLNNATVALGQQVGFGNVASLARASGIINAQGTPAVALGSYDASPLEMAGAYTVFANGGVHLNPWLLASVRSSTGDIVSDFPQQGQQVMDPRAAYLTQSLLEGVMTYGTAAAVRSRGFTAPAAGKTGTSHDVWFAGYTSNLLCIVWIGNDDYTNMGRVQGATAAAPIWADFMKRAQKLPQYSDMHGFTVPSGIQSVRLDKVTNLLADVSCPNDYTAAFLDGTAPQNTCTAMNESPGSLIDRIFGNRASASNDPSAAPNAITPDEPADPTTATNPDGSPKKKKGFFGKLFGSSNKTPQPDPNQPTQQTPAPVIRRPLPQ